MLRNSLLAAIFEYNRGISRPRLSTVTSSISLAVSGASSVSGRGTTRDFLLIWIIGFFCWITAGFCGVKIIFSGEEVLDISFVDSPEAFFDALALLCDQLFRLARQICDAIPNFRPPLKPTGIAVSIINIARFPANLTVSGYARMCRRTQSAIPLIFCGP